MPVNEITRKAVSPLSPGLLAGLPGKLGWLLYGRISDHAFAQFIEWFINENINEGKSSEAWNMILGFDHSAALKHEIIIW